MHCLAGRHLEPAAPVDRIQRQDHVCQQRADQQHRTDQIAPQQEKILTAQFHRLERDQPQCVVDQVGGHVDEKDEAGAEPQATDSHAKAPFAALFGAGGRCLLSRC